MAAEIAVLVTAEMKGKLRVVLLKHLEHTNTKWGDPEAFIKQCAEAGIGIVDKTRSRCWIDERVYIGALEMRNDAQHQRDRAIEALQAGGWPAVVTDERS